MNSILQTKTVQSCIAAESIGDLIAAEYELGSPIASRLMMAKVNDHYLITGGNSTYVARVYFSHHFLNESHYRFELELLTYLFKAGCPVATPIQRRDGTYLGRIDAPEGVRYYALFTFAEGKSSVPMSEEQSYLHGATVAQIHLASQNFQSEHQGYASDLTFLLDEPLLILRDYWGEAKREELDLLVELAAHLSEKILTLLDQSPDSWHIIGGNFTSTHTLFNEQNQPTYFDFDLCSYGWRAYDLAIFLLEATQMGAAPQISASFLAGYQSVSPLSKAEQDALLPLMLIRDIWLMGATTLLANTFGHFWFKGFYEQRMGELNMLWAYYQSQI